MVRSYIRIYGPPVLKALDALEAVAVVMSNAVDVKFSHKCVPAHFGQGGGTRDWDEYIQRMKTMYVDCYEPVRLISGAREMLGDYDFFYEWTEDPSMDQLQDLIGKIDEALKDFGCNYTITTK